MLYIRDLIDDPKCFETVRAMRRTDGATCPHRASTAALKDGRDDVA